jgi:hypothetical protein
MPSAGPAEPINLITFHATFFVLASTTHVKEGGSSLLCTRTKTLILQLGITRRSLFCLGKFQFSAESPFRSGGLCE